MQEYRSDYQTIGLGSLGALCSSTVIFVLFIFVVVSLAYPCDQYMYMYTYDGPDQCFDFFDIFDFLDGHGSSSLLPAQPPPPQPPPPQRR